MCYVVISPSDRLLGDVGMICFRTSVSQDAADDVAADGNARTRPKASDQKAFGCAASCAAVNFGGATSITRPE